LEFVKDDILIVMRNLLLISALLFSFNGWGEVMVYEGNNFEECKAIASIMAQNDSDYNESMKTCNSLKTQAQRHQSEDSKPLTDRNWKRLITSSYEMIEHNGRDTYPGVYISPNIEIDSNGNIYSWVKFLTLPTEDTIFEYSLYHLQARCDPPRKIRPIAKAHYYRDKSKSTYRDAVVEDWESPEPRSKSVNIVMFLCDYAAADSNTRGVYFRCLTINEAMERIFQGGDQREKWKGCD